MLKVLKQLMGSNNSTNKKYLDGNIDVKRASYIVTQPSLVVRTSQSGKEAPSKPIIVSVQQVSFSNQ